MLSREELVLAALAPAPSHRHTPVQVQKLLFLIDERIGALVGGKKFTFQPYDYGPFDKGVYQVLEQLSSQGFVEIEGAGSRFRTFRLTEHGVTHAESAWGRLDPRATDFITKVSAFVRRLSFAELVSAIYREYPEMKANSVFRE